MKSKNIFLKLMCAALLIAGFGAARAFAQPSDAQLKKVLTSAKTVSVTLGERGKIEWDSAYKKYVWTRYFTARLKTDAPGEILVVKGYAAYDVMGGRYVYWRTFTSSNSYEGKKNPTAAEINQALEALDLRRFVYNSRDIIGEFETFKISPEADWEWHTPNSVSFNVVAVYSVVNRGKHYDNEPKYEQRQGFQKVDKVEQTLRLRIYREDAKQPWNSVAVSERVPDPAQRSYLIEKIKLLERKFIQDAEVRQMPRMSKVPTLTE